MRRTIPVMAVLLAVGHVAVYACDKPPAQNVENVAAVAQYEALLSECRKVGKDAGSYAVYAACADAVDRKLCSENGLRCTDGGAR